MQFYVFPQRALPVKWMAIENLKEESLCTHKSDMLVIFGGGHLLSACLCCVCLCMCVCVCMCVYACVCVCA